MRSTAEKRHNDWKKAIRKRKIVEEVYKWPEGWYDNLHQYSKNKIYYAYNRFSKTNNKGKHRYAARNYAKSKNWSIADQRKLNSMNEDLEEQTLDNDENL